MQIRLLACEPDDSRVAEAIRASQRDGSFDFIEVPARHRRTKGLDFYEPSLRALCDGSIDALVAGASIALSEFLPLVFSTFKTSRSEHLLYSAAPVEPILGAPFLLVDPCVITSPQAVELAAMAEGAAKLYKALYARDDPFIAVLSHATGSYRLHRDRVAASTVEEIKRAGKVEVSEAILQLDAALSLDAARRKAAQTSKRPNVLICTDVGVANAIYKTIEVFGRTSVHLSGAIMMGLNEGLIGLLPRTCNTGEVCRLFSNLIRAARGFPDE